MALTVDLIDTFISGLSLTGSVLSHSDDGTNTTLVLDNPYHIRFNMSLDVDGTDYTVVSVDHSTNTVIVSGVIADPVSFTVPNPFYFHGTPYATNAQIAYLDDSSKVPMIYLMEILREDIQSSDSSIERTAELRLFFLDVANFQDWTTDQHYSKVITGLDNLVQKFILELKESNLFYTFDTSFRQINHVKFGQFQDLKGHIQSLFNDHLSGIELNFTLFIRKSC